MPAYPCTVENLTFHLRVLLLGGLHGELLIASCKRNATLKQALRQNFILKGNLVPLIPSPLRGGGGVAEESVETKLTQVTVK